MNQIIKLGHFTYQTKMESNPEDGSIYHDINTYKIYMAFNNKWREITLSDEDYRKELNKERKEKLIKINNAT